MPDGLSMQPEQTASAMSGLSSAGSAWDSAWSSAQSTINGLDGQLGKGILGQAFVSGYQSAKTTAVGVAAQCAATPEQLAAAGTASATDYHTADTNSRNSFNPTTGH